MSKRKYQVIATARKSLLISGFLFYACSVKGQNFVPATSLSGNPNPPQAFDIVNDNPDGNVGIGLFPTRPNPDEKLTVGGNISLYPDLQKPPTFERKITAHDVIGLVGIYSKDFDQCQGAGIRLNAVNSQNAGMVDLFSTGVSVTGGQFPAFLFTTYEPCLPFRRMVITRNGLTGIGDDIDGTLLDPNDRLSVDNSLALISTNDGADRYIRGRSTLKSLNVMVGSSPADGAGIELFGRTNAGNTSTPYTPSGITFTAYDFHPANTQLAVAYKFMHRSGGSSFMSFNIDQLGNARFGPNVPASERLSVDGDLYLVPANSSGYRNIVAHASSGGICIAAGTNQLDGGRIQLTAGTSNGQLIFNGIGSNATNKAFTFNTKNSGTAVTSDKLAIDVDGHTHLSNDLDFSLESSSTPAIIRGLYGNLHLYSHNNDGDGSGIHMLNSNTTFVSGYGAGSATTIYSFQKMSGSSYTPLMSIHNDGKVIIGDNNTLLTTGTYKLFVEDGIMTERVNVAIKNSSAWHDDVFAKDYSLTSLSDVEKYAIVNKHLPDIPSADEVVKNGLDVGAMESLLLKKIEELTLYAISQQKIIGQQANDILELKNKMAKIK